MKMRFLIMLLASVFVLACSKSDGQSERFRFLTTPTWESDSLLVDGEDASGQGQLLENFRGDARFRPDGTGYFGIYQGSWSFARNETEIVIVADSLAFSLTTQIVELTAQSLKITTGYPNLDNPDVPLAIRMTFNAK